MKCARCLGENLADASFCQYCGRPLERVCASCTTSNSPDSSFCRKCGTRLTDGADSTEISDRPRAEPVRIEQHVDPGQHVGERKVITVLFADVKGSMAILDGMDPDLAHQVMDPALNLMIAAVNRYGGYVAQAPGDGVFALFGAPIAHEDHARRALYAALSMQEQMAEYGKRLLSEVGLPPLQIRVGINTGEVVVRSIPAGDHRVDYSPIGHSTGLASRIENLAAPGSVLVSESTYRLTEGFFEFNCLGPIPMKGVSDPITIYEVTGIGPLRTRLEVSAKHGLARFVGRQPELKRMTLLLELAEAGQGQIVAVSGEAGVGKSRLCHEFKAIGSHRCRVLECASDSYGKAFPYLPLIDMLKNYLAISADDDDRRILEKTTGRVLALDRGLDDTIPFLLAILGAADPSSRLDGMDPGIRRRRTFDAIQRLFLREAENQPLLIVCEDLHWVDSETQSFLTTFASRVEHSPVLLLVNYRPDYHPAWDAATSHSTLRLNALDRDDATALLDNLLGDDAALGPLKQLIIDTTQGNAFFIEEYVHTLFDNGVLERTEDRPLDGAGGGDVVVRKDLSTIEMPSTVQGVLAARIDRLEPETKAFLQMLAVLGASSPLRLIEQMARVSAAEVQSVLTTLISTEFIYEQPAYPDVDYVFKHALTRETAYNELLGDARRSLHTRAAQAVETHYIDRIDDHCSELAHHYAVSDSPGKSVDFLRQAGQQAMQRSAYPAAVEHLQRALSLLGGIADPVERDERELQLQSMLGSALSATSGFAVQEVAEAFERARELCGEGTDAADLVRVLAGLGLLYINRGELGLATAVGEELLELAAERGDELLLVAGHEVIGLAELRIGALSSCTRNLSIAVTAYADHVRNNGAGTLGRNPAVSCGGFGAMARWLLGFPDQAVTEVGDALSAGYSATPKQPFNLGYALLSSVWLHQFRGESTIVLDKARTAVEFATEHGFPVWYAHALMLQGWAETIEGGPADGIAMIDQALSAYDATGAVVWRPLFMLLHGESLCRAGRLSEAVAVVDHALDIAGSMIGYWWSAELNRLRGELMLMQTPDDRDAAERCFRHAIDLAAAQDAKSLELRACTSLTRLQLDRGDTAAGAELTACYEWFAEGFGTADLVRARALLDPVGYQGPAGNRHDGNRSITDDVRPIIETLDQFCGRSDVIAVVRSARASALQQLDAAPQRGAVSVTVDLTSFGTGVPREARSMRVVIGRGVNEGRNERHANSEQYLLVLDGPVHTHVEIDGEWRVDRYGVGDTDPANPASGPLASRWHAVPRGAWHRSVAPSDGLWGVVAFHSVANVSDEFDVPIGAA